MTTKSREGRRGGRLPGIYRGPLTSQESIERPPVQHGARRAFASWRLFSALIIISLSAALFLFFGADAFYIRTIAIGGLNYMTKEEIFALADIANVHIFWVDPDTVRKSLMRSPTIADADVHIGWPPNMVQIMIQERQPALVWEQAGIATWIDLQGRVMRQRADLPDLLRIVTVNTLREPLDINQRIDVSVVNGALQMHDLLPTVAELRYDPGRGLGYRDSRGWDAWFGTGTDMPEKILIYNAIVGDLQGRGIQPSEVNIANPDAPYYCGSITGCAGSGGGS